MENHASAAEQFSQANMAKRLARRIFAVCLMSGVVTSTAFSQQGGSKTGGTRPGSGAPATQGTKPAAPGAKAASQASTKLSDNEKKQEKAREIFADAANAQNNGAFPLAIEQWKRLIKEYPNDSLISSARHFLGICYLQQETPNFTAAIDEFRIALKDAELKQREESLVNLGWSLYQQGMKSEGKPSKDALSESAKVLAALLDKYPDGSFADKALFYAGEAEARLGNLDRAISFYNQLVQNRSMESSTVRADALFGLGLSYDEQQQPILAKEQYDLFLSKYSNHPMAREVKLRSAEIAIKNDQAAVAVDLLKQVVSSKDFEKSPNADYALYRYGFALAKVGRFNDSATVYKRLADLFPKSQFSQNSSLAAGQTLMRDKKFDEAYKAFEGLLPVKDDRAAEAAHWMCQISILKGKPTDAVPVAREALKWGSKSPSAIALKMDLADGLSAAADGKAEAKTIYEQLAQENPDDPIAPRATYNAAFAALQLGAQADAQRWSEAFAKRFPNDPLASDVAYIRAEASLQLGQHESAATAFEQLITADPNNPMRSSWELRLAAAKYLGSQFDDAISLTRKALKSQTDSIARAEAYFLQGSSLLKLEKFDEAVDALKKSNEANAKWGQADEVLLILAEAQNARGKKEDAKSTLEKILKDFPNTRFKSQVEFRLGQISASTNDLKKALTSYNAVLSTSKDKSLIDFATYGKAFVLIQQEQFDDALRLLEPIAVSGRDDGVGIEARVARAICLRQLQRPTEAITVLDELLTLRLPADQKPKALYELGLSYSAADKTTRAIETFQQLMDTAPKFPMMDKVYYEMAWAHKSAGNLGQANEVFQKLTSSYPDSPLTAEAFFHLGQAEYDNSKFDRAIRAYTVAATRSVDAALQEKALYKMGWAFFQQMKYDEAIEQFRKQTRDFPRGGLNLDASFMIAESFLKQEKYADAWPQYESARRGIENADEPDAVSDQVRALVYLHGAQSARELKKWKDVETWITAMTTKLPGSPYIHVAKYELAYARQSQRKTNEALQLYSEVAEDQRNEIGARSRFMMGEVFFSDREFAKAISEFQKVMYGYGGTQAPDDIKNWQARAAYEAGRCSEVLISDQKGDRRKKSIEVARKFFEFVVNNHAQHALAKQAQDRINELSKM
ncbi:MAG: tetratricopeptide repeat protein [Pirellula sp.]